MTIHLCVRPCRGCSKQTASGSYSLGRLKSIYGRASLKSHNCIVMDPGHSLDFQARLAKANNPTPIVFIAADRDIRISVRAMKAGAIEFLTKPFRNQDLLDAVRNGIDRDRALRAEHKVVGELRTRFAALTLREREIMALLSAGREVKEIAGRMDICTHTARVHRNRVMSKIGARSIADLVRISDKLGKPVKSAIVAQQAPRQSLLSQPHRSNGFLVPPRE